MLSFVDPSLGNVLNTYPELLLLPLGNILDMSKRFFSRRVECAKRSWRFSTVTRIISVLHSYMQPPIIGKLLPVMLMATKIFSIMSAREVVETDLPYFKKV